MLAGDGQDCGRRSFGVRVGESAESEPTPRRIVSCARRAGRAQTLSSINSTFPAGAVPLVAGSSARASREAREPRKQRSVVFFASGSSCARSPACAIPLRSRAPSLCCHPPRSRRAGPRRTPGADEGRVVRNGCARSWREDANRIQSLCISVQRSIASPKRGEGRVRRRKLARRRVRAVLSRSQLTGPAGSLGLRDVSQAC